MKTISTRDFNYSFHYTAVEVRAFMDSLLDGSVASGLSTTSTNVAFFSRSYNRKMRKRSLIALKPSRTPP